MKTTIHRIIVLLLLCSCEPPRSTTSAVRDDDNMAYRWATITLECTANDTERFRPRPTVTSRMLALVWTAVFDAWSRYDDHAIPVYASNVERRPKDERTLMNKQKAISFAAYRALRTYYYSDSTMLEQKMRDLGFDPDDESTDPTSPSGIGNLAAKATIAARVDDGANQLGNVTGSNGKVYSDYTGYMPINSVDTLADVSRWQPKYFADGQGGKFCPPCLTPHWPNVKPFALRTADQFRPQPPPAVGSEELAIQIREVVELQAHLTDEQRGLIEFMRDGPKSVQQAGHWLIFAQGVSRRDHHSLDDDVKMFFLVENAAMDAFIASWDAKMHYDYARPYQLVHDYYKEQMIRGWDGPDAGITAMRGSQWRPYSPDTFLCPPFPSYVSGHSCVSGACAEVLKLFKSSDTFGHSVKVVPGIMTEPNNISDTVTLHFPTFTETANMAGQSRVLGGYHIQADNIEGLKLGRSVAQVVWTKYRHHAAPDTHRMINASNAR